ncbi:MAG: hypothetical protein J5634_03710 [Bacilli bacterium]|nr:hypothetical protein [Bacilli bacterium]
MDLYKLVDELKRIDDIKINIQMVEEYVLSLADKDGYIDRRSLHNAIYFFERNGIIVKEVEELIYNYLQYHSIQIVDKIRVNKIKTKSYDKDNVSRIRKG